MLQPRSLWSLFALLGILSFEAKGSTYPFDQPLQVLFESAGKAKDYQTFNQGVQRCAAILRILGSTGYLEGEGLVDEAINYYDSFYATALSNDLRMKGYQFGPLSPRDEVTRVVKEHSKVYEPTWQSAESIYVQVYGDWINEAGFNAFVVETDPDHPWSEDYKTCFIWGKFLYDNTPE